MSFQRRLYPSINALCALDAVARTGSFTRAASELSLTQSAVSKQVKLLEEQLGCRLFLRNTRAVELTASGRAFAQEIAPALATIRQAAVGVMSKGGETTATIAVLPTFGSRWLMRRLGNFLQLRPQANLNFITRIGRFDFAQDMVDAAVYFGVEDWKGADLSFLMPETVIPVASPDIISERLPDTLRLIETKPLLETRSRPTAWRDWLEDNGFDTEAKPGTVFEHFSLVTQACVAGIGLALLPRFLILPELVSGKLVPIGPAATSKGGYYLATPASRPLTPIVEAFRDWIVATARDFTTNEGQLR